MLCALVMAGGRGERFWPLSTDEKPKQFLSLLAEDTMIQMTVKRLEGLIPVDRVFIVTGKRYVNILKEQLPNLPERNIIVEPVGKNTAPCIALSAFIINKYYKNCTIAVLPSDHLINNETKFLQILKAGSEFIEENKNAIVTVGMKPDRPETGYGYIKYNEIYKQIDGININKVENFVEKPDYDTAKVYVNQGNFLWNGGMFIWKADTILSLTKQYLNRTYELLSEIAVAREDDFENVLEENYNKVDSISVDYGIMEKANNIYVIPAEFGWDDVGTWKAVERIREKDSGNNVLSGCVKVIESSNNIVMSGNKPIVLVGLNNVFVVESDNLMLIADKSRIDAIKDIKNSINR